MNRGSHKILIGDVREQLALLPADHFHCAVTSPPYWQQRDYQVDGQLGSEPTVEEYITNQVAVFSLVRNTLRPDGTLWLNVGDKLAGDSKWGGSTGGKHAKGLHGQTGISRRKSKSGAPDGTPLMIPYRLVMALQSDGWLLRQTIQWHKKSCMPESVHGWHWAPCRIKTKAQERGKQATIGNSVRSRDMSNGKYLGSAEYAPCPGCDRCQPNDGWVMKRSRWRPTTDYEPIFLLAKSPRYFCDGDSSKEPVTGGTHSRGSKLAPPKETSGAELNGHKNWALSTRDTVEMRNMRATWSLGNEPYKGGHFACFPSELVRRCLIAGTSAGGCCEKCGSPLAPCVISERVPTRPGEDCKILKAHAHRTDIDPATNWQHSTLNYGNRDPQRHVAVTRVEGYRPTCDCEAGVVPCRVLDPFSGSGTTAQVATWYGRDAVGIELNPEYARLAEERIATMPRCLARDLKPKRPKTSKPDVNQRTLFE